MAHGLGTVVVTLEQLTAAAIADALRRGWIEVHMPDVPTVTAGPPPGQPPHHLIVVDDEFQDDIQARPHSLEQLPQDLGLRHVAREPIKQEALGGVLLGEPISDHPDGDLIRNEITRIHVPLREHAEVSALSDVRPEDVSR